LLAEHGCDLEKSLSNKKLASTNTPIDEIIIQTANAVSLKA
jgi:hypothetical protein